MTEILICIICHDTIIEENPVAQVHHGDCALVASLALQLATCLPPNLRRYIQLEFDEAYKRVFGGDH